MPWNLPITSEEVSLLLEAGYLCRYTRHFDRAQTIFAGVRALCPDSEVPLVALGTIEFDQGRFASAISEYRKALELNPSSSYAYAHLAEAQLFQMDRAGARESLQTALRLDPRGTSGQFARSLLAMLDVIR
jgi:tetratricopeptide (TPR) repeat protein